MQRLNIEKVGNKNESQIVAQGVATKYELDIKHDTLSPDLEVGHKIHVTSSNDDSVTNTELGNVCDSVDTGLVQGLASGLAHTS